MLDFACMSLNITLLNPVQEGTDCSCDPANLESIHAKSVRSPTLKISDPGSYQDKLTSFEIKGAGRTALTGATFNACSSSGTDNDYALPIGSSSSSCDCVFVLSCIAIICVAWNVPLPSSVSSIRPMLSAAN